MQETMVAERAVSNGGQSRTVVIDDDFASKVKVYREKDGGFQRNLERRRIPGITEAMAKGRVCPPIIIGEIRGEYYILDGQHRFEAWKVKHFPLKAEVFAIVDMRDAARNFVEMNTNAKRVGLAMRLRVDPGEYATKLRALCKSFNITIEQGHGVLSGILGYGFLTKAKQITGKDWEKAKDILGAWSQDKRWTDPTCVYSHPAILRCIAEVVRDSDGIAGSLKEIRSMDFSRRGALARLMGGSHTAQKMMRQLVYENLARKVI